MGLSDDPPEKGMVVRHRALYCATHRTSCYKLFCEDCDMIICYECAVDGHQNHSYKLPTEGLVNRQRQRIQEVLDKLGQQLGEAHKLQRCVHDGLAALGTEAAKASNEVNAAFDALSAIASSRGKELLQPLQKEYGEWREQLLAERSVCSRALVDIWRTIDFLEKVLARGTDVEVLQVKSQLFKEWHQLNQLQRWRELGQRPGKGFWQEGGINAGWQSAMEADSIMRLINASGSIEVVRGDLQEVERELANPQDNFVWSGDEAATHAKAATVRSSSSDSLLEWYGTSGAGAIG